MANKKYALLDTDFVSKMHLIRKDDQNKLIDKIMAMPDYFFYCHEQISIELFRHNIKAVSEWFEARVSDKSICLYNDEMIIDELSAFYGELAAFTYISMLKDACDAYSDGYFNENFVELSKVNCLHINKREFLEKLAGDCDVIGKGKNLGELKLYVLLKFLYVKFGQQIYVFCSDDRNARNGIVSVGGARCISVLSSFVRLHKEIGLNREEAEPYFKSYIECCVGKSQTTFRILDNSEEGRMCKVSCKQVFNDIFSEKIVDMNTGNLKYL